MGLIFLFVSNLHIILHFLFWITPSRWSGVSCIIFFFAAGFIHITLHVENTDRISGAFCFAQGRMRSRGTRFIHQHHGPSGSLTLCSHSVQWHSHRASAVSVFKEHPLLSLERKLECGVIRFVELPPEFDLTHLWQFESNWEMNWQFNGLCLCVNISIVLCLPASLTNNNQ